MGFGSGVASADVSEYPGCEVSLECVDGSFEYANFGVDTADIEVGSSVLINDADTFRCKQRVDVFVDYWCLGADVGH